MRTGTFLEPGAGPCRKIRRRIPGNGPARHAMLPLKINLLRLIDIRGAPYRDTDARARAHAYAHANPPPLHAPAPAGMGRFPPPMHVCL